MTLGKTVVNSIQISEGFGSPQHSYVSKTMKKLTVKQKLKQIPMKTAKRR